MCAQKLMDASLIYCTETKNKKKIKKQLKAKMDMLRRNNARQETVESVRSLGWKGFVKQVGVEHGVNAMLHTYNVLTTVKFSCGHGTSLGVNNEKYEWIATAWWAT